MEEKEIIKSVTKIKEFNKKNTIKRAIITSIVAVVSSVLVFLIVRGAYKMRYGYLGEFAKHAAQISGLATFFGVFIIAVIVMVYLFTIIKTKLFVTDKRVYVTELFGKRVDLPLDSVGAVKLGSYKSIVIATSSGRIRVLFLQNKKELHEEICKLLIERQSNKAIK